MSGYHTFNASPHWFKVGRRAGSSLFAAWLAGLSLLILGSAATAATTLNVAMEEADNRPYEYLDERGQPTGFHVELAREVCAQLGWQLKFSRVPWARAQAMLGSGEANAVTYMSQNAEREKIATFLPDNMLHVMRVVLYVRTERASQIKYQPPLSEMMKKWRFGSAQGYTYNEEIDKLLKAGIPADQTAPTQAQLLPMLLGDRIDVAFVSVIGIIDQVRETIPDIDKRVQRVEGALFTGTPAYIAFTRKGDGEVLAREFAAAYRKYRATPAYGKLLTQFKVQEMAPDGFAPRR